MPGCNCGGKTTKWTAIRPDGSRQTYETQSQAAADVRANGGTYQLVIE